MKSCRLFIALLGLMLGAVTVRAQGVIFPRPCPRPVIYCPPPQQPIPQQPLRVKSIRFSTKIDNQVAVTRVEQVFLNETPYTLEGVYFFPLPDQVSITEFAMWDGQTRLVGETRSREEARRIYNEIVRSRRDPALLEYAGKDLFQASIFPIPPNSEKKIELTYSQLLTGESGAVSYRYPLGTGWRANGMVSNPRRPGPGPRREPENQIPDSNRESQPVGLISAEIEITSRTPIKSVYSPSHEIEVKRDGERKARLSFEVRASSSQPDFRLFYTLSEQEVGLSLLAHREPGKDGYFMLLVSPKAELDERETAAKDVIFVLDTSGSMADDGKIGKAQAALRFGVNTLEARDRFNIISFAGEEHLFNERVIAADEDGKRQAREFIDKMRATGGTNINDALMAAFKQLPSGDRLQMIVLITDGQPTVSITQPARILSNAREANRSKVRLFTFGVGYDVNTLLLDGLADENRGTVAYIEPNEDLEVKVSNFFAKVNHPVLSELRIDWGQGQTDLVYPRTLPDLFHGSQLVLLGRYRPANTRLTLTGQVNGRERRFVYNDLRFPEKHSDHEFLPYLWATRRVGYLLEQIRQNGESKELRDEIVELGTRYGIVTPYTSNLVLERRDRVIFLGAPGAPESSAQRLSGSLEDLKQVSGQGAVTTSKRRAKMKESDMVLQIDKDSDLNSALQQVAGKTFYLRDGVWIDSEFKPESKMPLTTIKFGGDEYFNLIAREPKLADFFALGQRVVVVWKENIYRIEE